MTKFISGVESTRYACPHLDQPLDILEMTRHDLHLRADFALAKAWGITELRYPLRMHRIMPAPGRFDWRTADEAVQAAEDYGITLLTDPMHHISYPQWLSGFDDPYFGPAYREFVLALVQRYPHIRSLTLFNEPTATLWLCYALSLWPPAAASEGAFVRVALQIARLMSELSHEVLALRPDMELLHVDTCEHYAPATRADEPRAAFLNQRRFFFYDLLLGRLSDGHPLYDWALRYGAQAADLRWCERHPAVIHQVGLDYYRQSEWTVRADGQDYSTHARGPARVMQEYAAHLQRPIFLGETNVFGPVTSRLSWLKFMVEQMEELARQGTPLHKFCWYPLFSADWSGGNVVRHPCGIVDHQGLFELEAQTWARSPSQLTHWYQRLAAGEVGAADLLAYPFDRATADYLSGTLHLMNHWEWQ